jgi:hypothetical protein
VLQLLKAERKIRLYSLRSLPLFIMVARNLLPRMTVVGAPMTDLNIENFKLSAEVDDEV